MPLYIRDDDVARLAREVQGLAGVATVTEAVRRALAAERDRLKAARPAAERLGQALALADALGRRASPGA